jgi:HEAT repeat protein
MYEPLEDLIQAIDAGDDRRAEKAVLDVALSPERVLPVLEAMLTSEDRNQRWWGVRAMAAIGSPEVVVNIVASLDDPDPDVRACAVIAVAELTPLEAIEPLVALLSDSSAYVARLAADGLARLGQPAVEILIEVLQAGETGARVGAARALSKIQPQEAVVALCAALDDPSAAVAYYAEQALEEMGVGMVYFCP